MRHVGALQVEGDDVTIRGHGVAPRLRRRRVVAQLLDLVQLGALEHLAVGVEPEPAVADVDLHGDVAALQGEQTPRDLLDAAPAVDPPIVVGGDELELRAVVAEQDNLVVLVAGGDLDRRDLVVLGQADDDLAVHVDDVAAHGLLADGAEADDGQLAERGHDLGVRGDRLDELLEQHVGDLADGLHQEDARDAGQLDLRDIAAVDQRELADLVLVDTEDRRILQRVAGDDHHARLEQALQRESVDEGLERLRHQLLSLGNVHSIPPPRGLATFAEACCFG